MDFFQAQKDAKNATTLLVVLFIVAVIGLIFTAAFGVYFLLLSSTLKEAHSTDFGLFLQSPWFFYTATGVLVVVVLGSFFKYMQLKSGGKRVALALGGKVVAPNTSNIKERMLLNIVDEIAIASSMPVPEVYILEDEGINAFAAGLSIDDCVIGITKGTLMYLSRDEIQGVIAHEFSHIYNGDMRLNIKLTALLHGILVLGIAGQNILRFAPLRSNNKKSGNASFFIGLALLIIGYVGYLVGAIIKSIVSRKREYLADATAVQYTRNPHGIACALHKINTHYGSYISSKQSSSFSHLFFSNALRGFWANIFATHPPLDHRIRAIVGDNNALNICEKSHTKPSFKNSSNTSSTSHAAHNIHSLHTNTLHNNMHDIDSVLFNLLHDINGTQSVLFAMLLHFEKRLKTQQLNIIQTYDENLYAQTLQTHKLLLQSPRSHYVSLFILALPTLRTMTKDSYLQFKQTLNTLIQSDKEYTFFEYTLYSSITRPLDIHFALHKPKLTQIHSLTNHTEALSIVFSKIAHMQHISNRHAHTLLTNIARDLECRKLNYITHEDMSITRFDEAIKTVVHFDSKLKKRILKHVIAVLKSDKVLHEEEQELLHTVGVLLQIPLSAYSLFLDNT